MILTREGIAIIERDTHIGKWIRQHKRLDFDINMMPRLLSHVAEGSVIFDIGAYIGDTTEALLTKGRVIAFEPNEEAFECLVYNMKRKNATCHNIALSDVVESYGIEMPNDNIGMARVCLGNKMTTTIDQYIIDYGIVPDFIKIDAEGFETKILKGGQELFKNHSPKMLLEVNEGALIHFGTSREELFWLISSMGYKISDIYGQDLNKLHTQFDIICQR